MIDWTCRAPRAASKPLMRAYSIASANWEEQLESQHQGRRRRPDLTPAARQPGDPVLIGRKPPAPC